MALGPAVGVSSYPSIAQPAHRVSRTGRGRRGRYAARRRGGAGGIRRLSAASGAVHLNVHDNSSMDRPRCSPGAKSDCYHVLGDRTVVIGILMEGEANAAFFERLLRRCLPDEANSRCARHSRATANRSAHSASAARIWAVDFGCPAVLSPHLQHLPRLMVWHADCAATLRRSDDMEAKHLLEFSLMFAVASSEQKILRFLPRLFSGGQESRDVPM